MRASQQYGTCAGFMLILLLVFARPAYGYIDPGTGSFLLQILIGSALGSLLVLKMFWRRITGFFAQLFRRKSPADSEQSGSAEAEPAEAQQGTKDA